MMPPGPGGMMAPPRPGMMPPQPGGVGAPQMGFPPQPGPGGAAPGGPGGPGRLDPDKMPSPIQVMDEDQKTYESKYRKNSFRTKLNTIFGMALVFNACS